jgi:hypothetical protein
MNKIDSLAIRAKNDEKALESLCNRLKGRIFYNNRKIPNTIRLLYDQDGDMKTFIWLLVKKFDANIGTFINFYENSFTCFLKSEYRRYKKHNEKGKRIFVENTKLYREEYYSMEACIANREAFYLACDAILKELPPLAAKIFKERLYPTRKTIRISIEDSFNKGGSDSPVRLKWTHIGKSLGVSYNKILFIVNQEIMPVANEIFRNYGFRAPYEYRDGISEKYCIKG